MLKPVLAANWRYIALLSYAVDPDLLRSFVPAGTEIDLHEGRTYLSVVAFLFLDAEMTSPPPPRNRDFECVSLQFYVRRKSADTWRHGAVSIAQFIPRTALPQMVRVFAAEHFTPTTLRREIIHTPEELVVEYGWKRETRWQALRLAAHSKPRPAAGGTCEAFLLDREWRYASTRTGAMEHRVEHPRFEVARAAAIQPPDFAQTFGDRFRSVFEEAPALTLLAPGGPVRIAQRDLAPD